MKHTQLILIGVITVAVTAAATSVTRFTATTGDTIVQEVLSDASASSIASEEISISSAESSSDSSLQMSESSSVISVESSSSDVSSSDASSSEESSSSTEESSSSYASSESFDSAASFDSSTSSTSSVDRLSTLKNLVLDRKEQESMTVNVEPTFLIPPHSDIANAEELQERMSMTTIAVTGESTEQQFTIASESGSYRVTLDAPRTFIPGRYRLIAELDRTRGITRTLQRFFRLTDQSTQEDSLVLIDEYIDWGMEAKNPEGAQDDGLIKLQRRSVSVSESGETQSMQIDVTATAGMTAVIRETVPAVFTVTDVQPAGSVTLIGDEQQIEWNTALESGITRTFSYSYAVGNEEPLFALFGPVELRGTPSEVIEETDVIEVIEVSSVSSASFDSSASSDSQVSSEAIEAIEDSSVSSDSSAGTGSTLQSFIQSFFNGIASLLGGSVTFDEDELFFNEDRRWQLLITDDELFAQTVRDRVLKLEREAAVFDANSVPSFTLVETDLVADATVLNGSGHLLPKVALQEILHAIVTDDQIEEAVMKNVLKNEAAAIAAQTLEDRTAKQELQNVVDNGSADALQEAVTDLIVTNTATQTALTEIVANNEAAADIVDAVVDADLTDSILGKLAERGTESIDTDSAITDALAQTVSTDLLTEAVVQTVVSDTETTDVIRANVDESSDSEISSGTQLIRVNLTGPDGIVINNVPFHFDVGSVVLVIDPLPAFTPGLYTVEVLITNPLSGEVTPMYQQFAWGVLAMNSDKDRYKAGETARIDFGVLDDHGEIVCSANLTLDVTAPDGSIKQLSTFDETIETTGTCGRKVAGFIDPDFTTDILFDQVGTYELTLTAETPNGIRSISGDISVIDTNSDAFTVKRTGATRLWPFAASTMDIKVTFGADTTGMVSERVAPGFDIVETEPAAEILTIDDGTTFIRWTGTWDEGEIATFHYVYDAPDISPQFYLLGPLRILTDTNPLTE